MGRQNAVLLFSSPAIEGIPATPRGRLEKKKRTATLRRCSLQLLLEALLYCALLKRGLLELEQKTVLLRVHSILFGSHYLILLRHLV